MLISRGALWVLRFAFGSGIASTHSFGLWLVCMQISHSNWSRCLSLFLFPSLVLSCFLVSSFQRLQDHPHGCGPCVEDDIRNRLERTISCDSHPDTATRRSRQNTCFIVTCSIVNRLPYPQDYSVEQTRQENSR